ncbi:MAG TPA: translation initiation factor IF-3 [Candidatus Kryptonia bacterium]
MNTPKLKINNEIRVPNVRLIDSDGKQLGVMPPREAMRLAENRGLDLVEIVPTSNPPVCKLVDYGKYMYELTKKEKAKTKGQTSAQLKEIRFHPNTDEHDFQFKSRHAKEFLEQGHKVKGSVFFKGREITYASHGEALLNRFVEFLVEVGKVEQKPKLEGKSMAVIIAPDKSKKKTVEPKQKETKEN